MDSPKSCLEKGNELCRERTLPMSCEVIEGVKTIYKQCASKNTFVCDPPLLSASYYGLEDIVWGFLECAKHTNTNLETGEIGEFQDFLWLRSWDDRTALDMAIYNDHVDVAKVLLANASLESLLSMRNREGKLPVSMLCGVEHDEFILSTLEAAKRTTVDPQASILIPIIDDQQESKVYIECKMDSHSYPVLSGEIGERKSLAELDHGKLELTPNKNTILHLVSKIGDVEYVKDILKKHPSLIYNHNSKGETPAYVAAMEGHVDILELMFNHLKRKDDIDFLFMREIDKQTALHIAIKNHHIGVVFWLMEKIPQHANHVNDFEETPLYLAAERGYDAILKLMLGKCNQTDFKGPKGLTTLHAAAISGSLGCIEYLLSVKAGLLYDQDKHGWTPLHFSVYHNNPGATYALLNADHSLGYQTIKVADINTSAIHIAASKGYCDVIDVLMSKCPGSIEITDSEGRNILHVAIVNNRTEVIDFIFQKESLATILINERDGNGNTPIHLLMASNLEMSEMIMDSRIDVNVLNNEKLSPLDMASSDEKRKALLKGITLDRSKHDKTSRLPPELKSSKINSDSNTKELNVAFRVVENILIVVTLIATATFAAAFTVPGGFQGNEGSKQGTPFLLRKPAFIAFVISNTIAFSCSCSVLFGHMVLVLNRAKNDELDDDEVDQINARTVVMFFLTGFAMLAMAIAFVTGLYVVLMPLLGLAIFSCVMSFFIIGVTLVFPSKVSDLLGKLSYYMM